MSHLSAALAGSVLALAIVSEGHAFIHAINMNAGSYRFMDQSGGVIGYAGDSQVAATSNQFGSGLSAVRPNGGNDWPLTQSYSGFQQSTLLYKSIGIGPSGATPISLSELDSWMNSNYRGTWNYEWNGADASSFDTTPYYTVPSSLNFVSLTPESVALFYAIRSQGLTGQFTFSIDQSVTSGQSSNGFNFSTKIRLGSQPAVSINGSSVTVNVTSPLAATATLTLDTVDETVRVEGPVWQVQNIEKTGSIYGSAVVPAPGAFAMFGLAGVAARRRRRG
jgi:MYXO-CTERM domain-containing protein